MLKKLFVATMQNMAPPPKKKPPVEVHIMPCLLIKLKMTFWGILN
jgi:hypothetical protein